MKSYGAGRPRRAGKFLVFLIFLVLVLGIVSISTALAASGEGGSKGWVWTDTFRVMNFAVLAIALVYLLRKPLSQALSSRIKDIKDELEDLEVRKDAAEKKLAEYNEKLAQLEKEAESIIEEYIKQGNEAKERILNEAQSSAEKLKAQARRNIQHEFEQAKLQLQEEIFETSLEKAEEILKNKISEDDQDRIVDEYLKKVVA
ncbi:ATP synthase F0 sector subunit b (EC [Olavius algarvensis Delta 1 endosymbiont]|nr:ATP synthase F0 sector subunit b (EC [Olavius algarvensis Delta 1 endosymbiont]